MSPDIRPPDTKIPYASIGDVVNGLRLVHEEKPIFRNEPTQRIYEGELQCGNRGTPIRLRETWQQDGRLSEVTIGYPGRVYNENENTQFGPMWVYKIDGVHPWEMLILAPYLQQRYMQMQKPPSGYIPVRAGIIYMQMNKKEIEISCSIYVNLGRDFSLRQVCDSYKHGLRGTHFVSVANSLADRKQELEHLKKYYISNGYSGYVVELEAILEEPIFLHPGVADPRSYIIGHQVGFEQMIPVAGGALLFGVMAGFLIARRFPNVFRMRNLINNFRRNQ